MKIKSLTVESVGIGSQQVIIIMYKFVKDSPGTKKMIIKHKKVKHIFVCFLDTYFWQLSRGRKNKTISKQAKNCRQDLLVKSKAGRIFCEVATIQWRR